MDQINKYHQEIFQLADLLYNGEEKFQTAINSLSFYRAFTPSQEFLATIYEPALCLIIQGSKEVGLGEEMFGYDPQTYLLASTHIPAKVKIIEASKETPYLSLIISFSMEQIFEVLKEIDHGNTKYIQKPKRGLYFGDVQTKLIEPITRLVRLLNSPEDIPVLSGLITKEILYVLLQEEGGDFIRQYIMDGSATQRIVQVITKLKDEFRESFSVKELAQSVGMSESALYQNFKKVTSMSPLQFQKSLRLQEARQMLLTQDIEAAQVAFDVGYQSPSQFSREYSRMYGSSPKADAKQLRGL
jgi:AraC-like DNA-binding protein